MQVHHLVVLHCQVVPCPLQMSNLKAHALCLVHGEYDEPDSKPTKLVSVTNACQLQSHRDAMMYQRYCNKCKAITKVGL